MRVSVITVCLNAAETIGDCLRSVASQSHAELEHVIVDGGSKDDTVSIVKQVGARVTAFSSGKDAGIYDAMNRGLKMAQGEFVVYLNADDLYADPLCVQAMAEALSETGADSAYADISYVRRAAPSERVRQWKSGPFKPGAFARGWAPPHTAFFAKRAALLELGGFDLRYRLASDFDLMMRALEMRRLTTTYVPKELVLMRLGGATNVSLRNVLVQNGEIVRSLWRAGFPLAAPGLVVRKVVDRVAQRLRARVASRAHQA
jgi:glycosyltransferase involved in cell wall biosynthesis